VKLKPFLARAGGRFRLADHDPSSTLGVKTKDDAERQLRDAVGRLRELQEKLWAQDRWALLVVLQGMDTSGKDSTIKHVMSGVNPQGCEVHSFKAPSEEELDHDYLWRTSKLMPRRGHICIFNRSYYEEVLITRVHPEILSRQKLPKRLLGKRLWDERYVDIRHHERYLTRNGIVVRKVFLHMSREEQRRRFLSRLEEPAKQWKFSMRDVEERKRWKDYMIAYEKASRATTTPEAPWYVVPADHKWFARLVVSAIVVDALEGMDLAFPEVDPAHTNELAAIRRRLQREKK
jgi:PPK2 family polyphosphate:nucleotide phosphotransferase